MKTRIQCIALLSAVFLLACGAELPATQDATDSTEADLLSGRAGTVFTLSNDIASNDVLAFRRAADGTLQKIASYSTTGLGSGDGLGSQGALSLSGDRRFLFAVSAGSNELAVFSVRGEQLTLVDAVSTGGVRPVSVTEHDGLVYVLHAGEGHNDVTGFYQRHDGTLSALRGSTHALSGPSVGPAQVSFSPSGRALIVTEKMTDLIDELRVDASTGLISKALIHKSSGATPFGFATTQRGQVIVSEAHGGADNASTVSSYQLDGRAGVVDRAGS